MRCIRCLIVFALVAMVVSCSCSKKKESLKDETAASRSVVHKDLASDEEIPFQDMIDGAGFRAQVFKKFPSQEQGVKGRILVYGGKKDTGGIIYFQKRGSTISPAWHWYFDDFAVDSLEAVELNDDGLWDIRVTDTGGGIHSLLQEQDFTLMARPRADFLALNGTSSPPAEPGHGLWKCFDGDSTTSWRTTFGTDSKATIELRSPFGVRDGILTIGTASPGCPKECDVFADGKRIDQLKLENTTGRQMFRLDESVKGATEIRIVFTAGYDPERIVSVTELSLK